MQEFRNTRVNYPSRMQTVNMDRSGVSNDSDITLTCKLVKYFYNEQASILYNNGSSITEAPDTIPWSPFHDGLATGNSNLINEVLAKLENNDMVKWLINTRIDVSKGRLECMGYSDKSVSNCGKDEQFDVLLDLSKNAPTESSTNDGDNSNIMNILKDAEIIQSHDQNKLSFELPLSIALGGGSKTLVGTLLQVGADVQLVDSLGNNVIHNLVHLSDNVPQLAVGMFKCLLELVPDLSTKQKLLHSRNTKQQKPIDLAASMGLPEMLHAIINMEGIYRYTTLDTSYDKLMYYDVTDYEKKDSVTSDSILYHLTNVDEKQLIRIHKFGLLTKEPFNTWFEVKFTNYYKHILRVLIVWLMFVMFFLFKIWLSLALGNDTTASLSLSVIVAALSICIMVIEFGYILENWTSLKHSCLQIWKYKKYPVTFLFPYRMIQLVYCITALGSIIGDIFACTFPVFVNVSYASNAILGTFSMFLFMQLNEGFGHLLITVQKMTYVTFIFSSMISMAILGYAMALQVLHINGSWTCPSHDNTDPLTVQNSTAVGFKTFSDSLYTTLLLMFLVTAPNEEILVNSKSPFFSTIIYMSMAVFIGIICLNLLIALMSQRMTEIYALKNDIFSLQRIAIVLYFEQRLRSPMARFVIKWSNCLIRWSRRRKIQDDGLTDQNNIIKKHGKLIFLKCRESCLVDNIKI